MGAPAGLNLSWLVKYLRDQFIQSPLPIPAKLGVGTLTVKDGIHFEGGDIQMSPEALAAFKTLLGL